MKLENKKVELLAPAGSMDALIAAVQNGCDAVYIGGNMFGARAFANNFNSEEMIRAINYCHVYGVRVFVTVNTLMKEEEIDDCVAYVQFLYEHDADAVIVQDLGLFSILRQKFPDMELHASTQMHIHNPQGIEFMKSLGASRVVVPRETPIEEIREYSKLGIDLEVFVQGAICVSYSGQCLMSSLTLHRSGNRGECAQNCRMKYQLEKEKNGSVEVLKGDGDYLLSPKDMNTLSHVPELIEAGIYSFKIEGRMKRPEYVALMVSLYRKAINAYYEGKQFVYDDTIEQEMKKVFNRGFTAGHLFHSYGPNLMNPIRPNHIGIEIGRVIGVTKQKIRVKLTQPLHQGDGIRILQNQEDIGFTVNFLYKDGLLVNHANANDVIELDKTANVYKGNTVLKTSDVSQLSSLQNTYQKEMRKVDVFGRFEMQINNNAILEVMDEDGRSVCVKSEAICEKARTAPLAIERIDTQLHKTKDTPFKFIHIEYQVEEGGILPIRELNQMRRDALDKLQKERMCRNGKRKVQEAAPLSILITKEMPSLCVIVHTKDQLDACLEEGISHIFVENEQLYEEVKDNEFVYPRTPRVMKDKYKETFSLIQETGGLSIKTSMLCDTSLNMTNSYTAAFLFHHNACGVAFSLESSLDECKEIMNAFYKRYQTQVPFYYTIYSRDELMLTEYCPINAVELGSTKRNCGLCRGNTKYALVDMKKHRYPLLTDEKCRVRILHYDVRNEIDNISMLQENGIHHFLCTFTIEDKVQCLEVLRKCKKRLAYD